MTNGIELCLIKGSKLDFYKYSGVSLVKLGFKNPSDCLKNA